MALAQLRTDLQSGDAVAFLAGGGGAQQRVGYLGHGADNNYRLLAESDAPGDDGRGARDGRRVLDRCAAELHDYKAHAIFLKTANSYQLSALFAGDSSDDSTSGSQLLAHQFQRNAKD
jgi:hypothetical protein